MHQQGNELVTRVKLRNYKSIGACDVPLTQLSYVVGRNASGKSNFLDSLSFVADSLRHSVDHALEVRGGIKEVRRRSHGHPRHFGFRLEFNLAEHTGHYAALVGAKKGGGHEVQREECRVEHGERSTCDFYRVERGSVLESSFQPPPPASSDRLYLVHAAGFPLFRQVYNAFSRMGFYNLNPASIRDLQSPDSDNILKRDGRNVAGVLADITARAPKIAERIDKYVEGIAPGIVNVRKRSLGPKQTLEFKQQVGERHPWRFLASNMSDGTLRAVGVLVALFQHADNGDARQLVGVEEPEATLHPAAVEVLMEGLVDAADHVQVVIASHSADLLDADDVGGGSILAVYSHDGETKVGPLDDVGQSALKDHLFTAGELLRMDQLRPSPDLFGPSRPRQPSLFGN